VTSIAGAFAVVVAVFRYLHLWGLYSTGSLWPERQSQCRGDWRFQSWLPAGSIL